MILLEKGTIKELVLSLSKLTIEDPIFRFEFINDITKESVIFDLENTSLYTERYFQFELNVDDYFLNSKTGFWTYRVYEFQASPEIKNQLEIGKMKLIVDPFTYTEYNGQSEEFITYN